MKKTFFILMPIILILLSSCWKQEMEVVKYFNTSKVSTWVIIESNHYVWYTDSFSNTTLSAKVWWRITDMKKNIWDNVIIWELIASLDWNEAKTWYSWAWNIILSLENLKNSTIDMFDKQIADINHKIEQANIWLDASKTWKEDVDSITDANLRTIESQINSLENQIKNTNNLFETKRETLYSNSLNSIINANIFLDNTIDFLDNLFWVTDKNKNKNNSFEIYLWAKNSWLKNETENMLRDIISKKDELKSLPKESREEIINTLKDYNSFFSNQIREVLKFTSTTLENSVSSSSFPESMIQELKAQVTNMQNQNEQIILSVSGSFMLWLKWSLDNITSLEKEYNVQIEQLEKQLLTLKETYKTYEAEKLWQLNEMNSKTQISQKQLEEIKDSINTLKKQKEAKVKEIDSQIATAKASQSEAWVMIENTRIISPLSWIITQKNSEVWEVVWAWTPIYVISDNSKIKIEIQVWEDLIKDINILDLVQVEIEWNSEIKKWIIKKILPTKDMTTKRVSLEIELDNSDNSIKLWSYARVYITKDIQDYWIIIPNKAILQKYLIPWVYVLKDSKAQFKKIEIIKQNDSFSQILWLDVWDVIITDWKENIYDNEILKINE